MWSQSVPFWAPGAHFTSKTALPEPPKQLPQLGINWSNPEACRWVWHSHPNHHRGKDLLWFIVSEVLGVLHPILWACGKAAPSTHTHRNTHVHTRAGQGCTLHGKQKPRWGREEPGLQYKGQTQAQVISILRLGFPDPTTSLSSALRWILSHQHKSTADTEDSDCNKAWQAVLCWNLESPKQESKVNDGGGMLTLCMSLLSKTRLSSYLLSTGWKWQMAASCIFIKVESYMAKG